MNEINMNETYASISGENYYFLKTFMFKINSYDNSIYFTFFCVRGNKEIGIVSR